MAVIITQSGSSTLVTEGGATDSLSIALSTRPTSNVTVTITGDSDVAVAGKTSTTLTFTRGNWNIAQIVAVSAVDDTAEEDLENATIRFSTASKDTSYNNLAIAPVPVSITDNDQPPPPAVLVTQSGGATAVTEGGATDTLAIVLSRQPIANVTVTVNGNSDLTVAGSASTTFTFTPLNWNIAQTLTVAAVDDAAAEGLESANITFSASSSDARYNNLTVAPVSASITDNDQATPPAVLVTQSGGSTAVTEGGATDTLSIALSKQPSANVTVTVTGNSDLTVGGSASATFTFTPLNWNIAQTMTVAAVDDATAEGLESANITFSTASSDTSYNNLLVAPVSASITDNDGAPPAPTFSSQEVISGISNPTSLQFGPDGRLYVSQQNGLILVFNITQPSPGTWAATISETIDLIKNIPNHNDDGSLNIAINDRQVTGILVTGSASNTVIYVTSSDPRIANNTTLTWTPIPASYPG